MADQTSYLKLLLPGLGEYVDAWWDPLNENFSKIDTWSEEFGQEILDARFSQGSLKLFLEVAHNSDGTLKATGEVINARNSPVYGFQDLTPEDFTLGERINEGDWEAWRAREGQATLRDAQAFRMPGIKNQIFEGSSDGNGYPAWMGFTANKVQVDGSVETLWMTIDGKLCRVRTLKELTLSGAAGVKYIYASFQAAGVITVDGDSTTPPPASPAGTVSNDVNGDAVYFTDATKDFTAEDVQPGDLLDLLDTSALGKYLISAVAPGAVVDRLQITGIFPVTGLSSINYTLSDPLAVTLGFDTTETPAGGKFYIGEADYDGSAVTAVRPRHFGDTFVGEWRAIDVTSPTTFEEIFNHKLGSDLLDISIQASQNNDGSTHVEELALGTLTSTLAVGLTNTLGVSISNSLAYNAAIFNPGTSDASYTPGSLTGTVTGSLTGSLSAALSGTVTPDSSVAIKWDKNRVWVKNLVAGKFYRDYGGTARTSGFLRVVVRKRG